MEVHLAIISSVVSQKTVHVLLRFADSGVHNIIESQIVLA